MAMSLAAMAAALAGLLPAVWGALLQEAIDIAVILNALRALRPDHQQRLAEADTALTRRFASEHETIRPAIEQIRAAADAVGVLPPGQAMASVRAAYQLLTDQINPHEAAEEQQLYPALDRILGGHDATATMSRVHAEIAHQTRRLGQLLDDIGQQPPDATDLADLRALLYGLHAILRLHTAQEDESYLSLDDGEPAPAHSPVPAD
jgi:iron-sulfur cluster repair protein YtfE (RIC family)